MCLELLWCRHACSAVRAEIAELLCLPPEVHCPDPASRLAIGVSVADCATLLNPVWSALVIGRIMVWATYAASNAWLRAKPTVPPAMLAAIWGAAMVTIMKMIAKAAYVSIVDTDTLLNRRW